jgi:hypothetical protein
MGLRRKAKEEIMSKPVSEWRCHRCPQVLITFVHLSAPPSHICPRPDAGRQREFKYETVIAEQNKKE